MNEELLLSAEPVFTWLEITLLVTLFAIVVIVTIVITDKSREYKNNRRGKW
jgi:hypothetical protein